jgi:hypothetical protein
MRKEYLVYIGFAAIMVLLVGTFLYDSGTLWGPCGGSWGGAGRGHHGMHQRGFFGVGFYGFGLLFWVLVAFFVILVWLNNRGEDKENGKEYLRILKKRVN